MRKAGWFTAIFGGVLSVAMLLVLRSRWYAAQSAGTGSDFAEMAASAFWAALVMTAFGVVLVLVSLRQTDRAPEIEKPAPLEVTWVCPYCGGENTKADQICCVCGLPRYIPPGKWTCEWCGTENLETSGACSLCHAPAKGEVEPWYCPDCGSRNPRTILVCLNCGASCPHAPDETWTCRTCQSQVSVEEICCPECGTPRIRPSVWFCDGCGNRNPNSLDRCFVCRKPRFVPTPAPEEEEPTEDAPAPEDEKTPDAQAAPDDGQTAPEARAPEGPWVCGACGCKNPGHRETCFVCGTARSARSWVCRACGCKNQPDQARCLVCGKPDEAPAWFCPECGCKNPGSQKKCLVCGTVLPETEPEFTFEPFDKPEAWFCPECGCKNPGSQKKCLVCGTVPDL